MYKVLIAGLMLTFLVGCPNKTDNTQNDTPQDQTEQTTDHPDEHASEMKDDMTDHTAEEDVQPMMHMVMFEAPESGAEVKSPFTVKMGVEGMDVKPAGEVIENTGHHHLIIDGEPIPKGEKVPADDTHMHFGKGQTEVELNLAPGKHTLTLQFADGAHTSYGSDMSTTIDVTVIE